MRPTANACVKLAKSQIGYKAPGPGKRKKRGRKSFCTGKRMLEQEKRN